MSIAFNRVQFLVDGAAGTGPITVGSAVATFITPAQAGMVDGDYAKAIVIKGGDFEIFETVYTASGTVLSRGTVELSLISGTPGTEHIDLEGGETVFLAPAAIDHNRLRSAVALALFH